MEGDEHHHRPRNLLHHTHLFLSALRTVTATNNVGYMENREVYCLSITSKDLCAIIKQSVKTLSGDSTVLVKLLGAHNFTAMRDLCVSFHLRRRTSSKRLGKWKVPSAVVAPPTPLDLSQLRALTVRTSSTIMSKHKNITAGPGPFVLVNDPLASIMIPALGSARLVRLELVFKTGGVLFVPGLAGLVASPCCVSSLTHLALTSSRLQSGHSVEGWLTLYIISQWLSGLRYELSLQGS